MDSMSKLCKRMLRLRVLGSSAALGDGKEASMKTDLFTKVVTALLFNPSAVPVNGWWDLMNTGRGMKVDWVRDEKAIKAAYEIVWKDMEEEIRAAHESERDTMAWKVLASEKSKKSLQELLNKSQEALKKKDMRIAALEEEKDTQVAALKEKISVWDKIHWEREDVVWDFLEAIAKIRKQKGTESSKPRPADSDVPEGDHDGIAADWRIRFDELLDEIIDPARENIASQLKNNENMASQLKEKEAGLEALQYELGRAKARLDLSNHHLQQKECVIKTLKEALAHQSTLIEDAELDIVEQGKAFVIVHGRLTKEVSKLKQDLLTQEFQLKACAEIELVQLRESLQSINAQLAENICNLKKDSKDKELQIKLLQDRDYEQDALMQRQNILHEELTSNQETQRRRIKHLEQRILDLKEAHKRELKETVECDILYASDMQAKIRVLERRIYDLTNKQAEEEDRMILSEPFLGAELIDEALEVCKVFDSAEEEYVIIT